MGLRCSHDAFNASYGSFNRLRQCIAEAIGGSFPSHYVYGPRGERIYEAPDKPRYKPGLYSNVIYFPDEGVHPGMSLFLLHSDCDGEFSPEECTLVADALEAALPRVDALGWDAKGFLINSGGYVGATQRFIAGCRKAAALGEPLTFR